MGTEPETANTKSHSSAWHWFAWSFAILLIAYPLSIGPVGWLLERGVIPLYDGKCVECIYKPLHQLYDHSDSAKHFIDWYYHIWCPPKPFVIRVNP